MKIARDGDLVAVAILLSISAAFFYTVMTGDVEQAAPLRNFWEFNNLSRVWREHKRHFPSSRLRKIVTILTVAAMICLVLSAFLG